MDFTAPSSQPAAPVPSRRSVVPVILLVGVLVGLFVAGFLIYRLIDRPGTAEDVARDFLIATYEGDIATTCELSAPAFIDPILDRYGATDCDGLVEAARDDPSVQEKREAADVEVLEATEDSNTASLRISSPNGTPGTWTRVDLELIDDQWRVSDFSG